MQITRSLGYGHSGLFCVDTSGVCVPTSPQARLEQLMQLSRNPEGGIRLEGISEAVGLTRRKPKVEFIFNRWPRFTPHSTTVPSNPENAEGSSTDEEKTHPRLSLQYFCHKGTVFQRYIFNHNPGAPSALHGRYLYIRRDFLIRNLDFVNESAFNNADEDNNAYVWLSGLNGFSQIAVHRMVQEDAKEIGIDANEYEDSNGPKAVALIVTAFVNGKIQRLYRFPSFLVLNVSSATQAEMAISTPVTITIAYRLQTLTSTQYWRQPFTPASALTSMNEAFSPNSNTTFQRLRWSSNVHINFITGRNLEHILSVCSMPVPKRLCSTTDEDEMDTTSLALTCGDVAGHRIAITASLWVFLTRS